MSTNWEDKAKKNKNIPLVILLSILLVISIIFVFNNLDIFTTREESVGITEKEEKKTEKKPLKIEKKEKKRTLKTKQKEKKKPEKNRKKISKKEASVQKKNTSIIDSSNIVPSGKDAASILKDSSKSLLSVELSGVKCAIADRKNLKIKVHLRFYFKGERLRKEILLKRENLKIMIKRVLKRKKHSEIIADALRIELIKEVNILLEQGKIENIEFLDFQPVKTQ
jgi:hypothetical protein